MCWLGDGPPRAMLCHVRYGWVVGIRVDQAPNVRRTVFCRAALSDAAGRGTVCCGLATRSKWLKLLLVCHAAQVGIAVVSRQTVQSPRHAPWVCLVVTDADGCGDGVHAARRNLQDV